MNNYRNEIVKIIDSANSTIKVAVSWFTDEFLIEKLIERAADLRIEVLLSSDEVNLLRHNQFRRLQSKGARVHKIGSNDAILGNFMHGKFIIIDSKMVFGGSYNFTINAITNYENFKRYAIDEVKGIIHNFDTWFSQSVDLFSGIISAEDVVKKLKRKFLENDEHRKNLSNKLLNQKFDANDYELLSPKEKVIEAEIRKDELKKTTNSIKTGESGLNKYGVTTTSSNGIRSRNHSFYGGYFISDFNGKKLPNSYAYALLQKKYIEKSYNFFKFKIINDTLICKGTISPDYCQSYDLRIEFRAGDIPRVYILNPKIQGDPAIHLYKEGCLCLFYPGDMKWKINTNIAEYTIPWIYEWILYYELWKITGKWEGPEKLH